jgi:hypothetical protein
MIDGLTLKPGLLAASSGRSVGNSAPSANSKSKNFAKEPCFIASIPARFFLGTSASYHAAKNKGRGF